MTELSYCRSCGQQIQNRFCPSCNIGHDPQSLSPKSYGTAMILCGIFGVFGIHHFYLKNWLHGLFDLSLSITGIWLIGTGTSGGTIMLGLFLLFIDLIHTIFVMYQLITGSCRDGDGLLVPYPGQRMSWPGYTPPIRNHRKRRWHSSEVCECQTNSPEMPDYLQII